MPALPGLDPAPERFARASVRKKRLFLGLSIAGLLVAALLGVYIAVRRARDPEFSVAPRAVIVLLVLLNARQNLRQYRYAEVLERLLPPKSGT